jgi:3-oxoacyl-[acyl-carrier protein] reductase
MILGDSGKGGNMTDLDGLRVLVTGGATGIGGGISRALAAGGGRVAAQYHAGDDAAVTLEREAQGAIVTRAADLLSPTGPADVVAWAADALGGLDAVVNNAGGMVGRVPFAALDDAFIDRVFDLNVRQAVKVSQAALPHLEASDRASILFVSSISARTGGSPGSSMYSAAKAFLSTLTRALAKELGPSGIRVNAISPGTIDTAFHQRHSTPEKLETTRGGIPLARLGTPEDCAGPALALLSPALGGYVTGQVLEINGGQLLA